MLATEAKSRHVIQTTGPVIAILCWKNTSSEKANTKTLSKTYEVRMCEKLKFLHRSRETRNVIMAVLLETTLGDIVMDLFTEERPKSKKIDYLDTTAAVFRTGY